MVGAGTACKAAGRVVPVSFLLAWTSKLTSARLRLVSPGRCKPNCACFKHGYKCCMGCMGSARPSCEMLICNSILFHNHACHLSLQCTAAAAYAFLYAWSWDLPLRRQAYNNLSHFHPVHCLAGDRHGEAGATRRQGTSHTCVLWRCHRRLGHWLELRHSLASCRCMPSWGGLSACLPELPR